jgi:cobalt-zinc-cadmium efflux system membrane fusion protein
MEATVTAEQFTHSGMKWGVAEEKTFYGYVHASGKVETPPSARASISPMFGGYVQNFNLLPGNRVSKGQVLFYIENPLFIHLQREYLELKEQLTFLKADFENQTALSVENISSKKEALRAESAYKTSLARFESAGKKLQLMGILPEKLTTSNLVTRMSITAPIPGHITEIMITNGKYINPEDVALQILNSADNHVDLYVLESDINKIKPGQKIKFSLGQGTDQEYEGTIALVGKEVSEKDRTVEVHAHAGRGVPETAMIPGMFVKAKLLTGSHVSPAVPESAVIRIGQSHIVLAKKEEIQGIINFEQIEIVPGMSLDGWVEIRQGDLKNKEILVRGGNLIPL